MRRLIGGLAGAWDEGLLENDVEGLWYEDELGLGKRGSPLLAKAGRTGPFSAWIRRSCMWAWLGPLQMFWARGLILNF